MNWFLLLTFAFIVLLVRFIVRGKPSFDWDKENRTLYLWSNIYNKYGDCYRDYVIKLKLK